MRRITTTVAVLAAMALGLAGCGGGDDDAATPSGSGGSAGSGLKVGMAYDIGGRGDQSFNDAAAAGLDKAKAELGVQASEAEAADGEAAAAKEERLRQLAEGGYNPIVAVGFAYAPALKKVAPEYPDTKFALIDSADTTGPNITNLLFAEEQGSFLVGVAAALKSTKGSVGFIGGVNVPLIQKFEAGFKAGVAAAKPGTKVQVKYLSEPPDFKGFSDPAKAKTAAQGMIDGGADVIYAAAGGSGGGMFEAAKAAGIKAIGVDSDQALTAAADVRDVIMTSMVKKVDVAVFQYISDVKAGKAASGSEVFDLKVGGVDYSKTGGKVDDIAAQIDDYKQKIISGSITVPSKP